VVGSHYFLLQVHCFWLTKAIVRHDPDVLEFIQAQVEAESAGALLPSAAPRGVPQETALCYLIALGNLLFILEAQGAPVDDQEQERRLALQERLFGIYRFVDHVSTLSSIL
jgi:hypothetical protein